MNPQMSSKYCQTCISESSRDKGQESNIFLAYRGLSLTKFFANRAMGVVFLFYN